MIISKGQRDVIEWNKNVPIGSPVWVTDQTGETISTVTDSEAYLSNEGTPVVMIEGQPGSFLLTRVRVIS